MELGVFVKCPHPEMIEALGIAGVDFAVVDMEHTPLGPRDLHPLLLAANSLNEPIKLVVRVPENQPHWIKWALDLGITLIQIPDIRTGDDARRAYDACYFAPKGNRGLCRFVRSANYSNTPRAEYIARANDETRPIFQIESKEALENLEAILAYQCPILIGPYDLSASLGVPGDIWSDAMLFSINAVIRACKVHNVQVGVFTDTPAGVAHWRAAGVDFVQYGSDLQLLLGAVKGLFDA